MILCHNPDKSSERWCKVAKILMLKKEVLVGLHKVLVNDKVMFVHTFLLGNLEKSQSRHRLCWPRMNSFDP